MGSNGEIPVFLIGSTAIFCSGINEKYSQVCPVFPFRYTACFFSWRFEPHSTAASAWSFCSLCFAPQGQHSLPNFTGTFRAPIFLRPLRFFPGRCRAVFFPRQNVPYSPGISWLMGRTRVKVTTARVIEFSSSETS